MINNQNKVDGERIAIQSMNDVNRSEGYWMKEGGEIRKNRFLTIWIQFLVWIAVVVSLQISPVLIEDLIELSMQLNQENFPWYYFFQVIWGASSILSLAIIAHLSLTYSDWRISLVQNSKLDKIGMTTKLVVGALLRALPSPFLSQGGDTTTFLLTGYYMSHGQNPYNMTFDGYGGPTIPLFNLRGRVLGEGIYTLGYPPLWGIFCSASYILSSLIVPDNLFAYIFSIKSWIIASDLLVAFLLKRIATDIRNEEVGKRVFSYYLLCPLPILVCIWGQIDSSVTLLILLAVFLYVKGRYLLTGVCLGAGFALKYYPILFVPIFFFSLRGRRKQVGYLALTIVSATVFSLLPFVVLPREAAISFFDFSLFLIGDMGTLFTPFYVAETLVQITGKDAWIWAWFWLKENPIIRNFWLLPLIWLFLIWKRACCSSPEFLGIKELIPMMISVEIIFLTFVYWTTEQLVICLLALSLLDRYCFHQERKGYVEAIWVTTSLHAFFNLRLGSRLLMPIWNQVKYWAIHITHQGSLYMFWMRSITTATITLFFVTYNIEQLIANLKEIQIVR